MEREFHGGVLPDGSWDLQSGDTCRKEARGINMPTSLSHLLPDLLLSPLADPTGTRARELIEAGHQVTLLRHETGRGESRVDMEEQMGETQCILHPLSSYFQNVLRISMPLHLPGTASSDPPIVSAAPPCTCPIPASVQIGHCLSPAKPI